MTILIRWFILSVAVWAAVEIVPGIHYDSWTTVIMAALVLGILNTLVKPILTIVSIPFILVTLGLFLVVINAVILKMTAGLVSGFTVDSWGSAFLGSIVISIVSMLAGRPNVQVRVIRN